MTGGPLAASSESDSDSDTAESPVQDGHDRATIGKNVFHLLSSQTITWALALILAVTQPRLLGPDAQGQLRLAFSLWTIAGVVIALGTGLYLTLEVARRREDGLALIGPVLAIRAVGFLVASCVMAAYLVMTQADSEFVLILGLYGLVVLFGGAAEVFAAAFVGIERMGVLAVSSIVSRVIGTALAVAVLLAGGDASSVVLIAAGANLIGLLILGHAFRSIATVRFRGAISKVRPILRGSFGFLLAGAILTTYQQVDTVIMSFLVDTDALGWYGTADTLFGSLLFIPTIVMGAVFPVLGRLHTNDPAAIAPLVKRTGAMLLLVTVPIGLGTAAVAGPVAPLLYGDDFRETGPVLAVLGPVIILTAGNVLFGTIALSTGRQRLWNLFMAGAILVTVPIDLVLVPWTDERYSNGAIGGALAYLVTESLLVVAGLVMVAPYLADRAFVWRAARIGIAGALMFAVAWPLRDELLLIPVLAACVVYALALVVLRVPDADDRRRVGNVLSRVGIGRGG